MAKLAAMFRSGALEKLLSLEAAQSKQCQRERGGPRLPCEGQGDEAVEVAQGHQGEVAGGLV